MTQETNQPLYKRLNEQRTQGEWNIAATSPTKENFKLLVYGQSEKRNGTATLDTATFSTQEIWNYNKEEVAANAQYTALAVNELANLAEALDKIDAECIKALEQYANGNQPNFKTIIGAISETAKQALNRIS